MDRAPSVLSAERIRANQATIFRGGAIDIVAAEVKQALGVVQHNWTRCLNIVKTYRDENINFDVKELEKGFVDLDSKLHRVPHHRIGNLIGSQLIWDVYQLAMAFAANANTKITREIPETIRLKVTTNLITKGPKQLADALFQELWEIDNQSHKFASLTRVLHDLGHMLETKRLNFKSIVKLRGQPEVKQLINRLQTEFASRLQNGSN